MAPNDDDLWAIGCLFWFAVWFGLIGGVLYVVAHFILKYW